MEHLLKDKSEWGPLATFVPNKKLPVYNWIYYKEGFSRNLVLNFFDRFELKPGQTILDPFCGSGTTLLACKERGVDSVGVDSLPLAVLASRVKTRDWDNVELRDAAKDLFDTEFRKVKTRFPFSRYFNKHVLEDILLFREEIDKIRAGVRDFFLLSLITSAMRASWVWKDGTMLKVKKHPVPPFRKFFKKRVMKMIKESERFKGGGKVKVELADPRSLPVQDNSIDGVITSPPYLNQIDYSRVYAVENWFLEGHKLSHYIGTGREKGYFKDMDLSLKELFRVCKPGARVGIVVGNAYFPREDRIVDSDVLLADVGEEMGFKAKEILVLNKRFALQRRTIKKGVLRESLIILEK